MLPLGDVPGAWDLVVSTAPPTAPEVAAALARVEAATIAAVTQVPSEAAALQRIAGDGPCGLLVPGFLAWGAEPTRWWRMRPVFAATGRAAPQAQRIFATRIPQISTGDALLQAATVMPVVTGLQTAGFELSPTKQQVRRWAGATDEARRAVAATHDLPAPRRIRPLLVQGALATLARIAPMDLRGYLRSHFSGHTEQTTLLLSDWIDDARRHGLDSIVLEELRTALATQEGVEQWSQMR